MHGRIDVGNEWSLSVCKRKRYANAAAGKRIRYHNEAPLGSAAGQRREEHRESARHDARA
jgi:hypothetical protein